MDAKKVLLTLLPFASFLAGYVIMAYFFGVPSIETPNLIGKHLHEILPIISKHNLNLRLIEQKDEPDLPQGIILNQIPSEGHAIKPHQSIFVVTTKKPPSIKAPECIGTSITQIVQECNLLGISPRVYYLPHPYPEGICFAQAPLAHESLEKNKLMVYVSSGNDKPIIWPSFIGKKIDEIVDFLDNYHIKPYILTDQYSSYSNNSEPIVIDQRPAPGTLITLDEKKPLSVHVRIG